MGERSEDRTKGKLGESAGQIKKLEAEKQDADAQIAE